MNTTHTKDLSDMFFSLLTDIALELGAKPHDMLCVMMAESGVMAKAHNPNGHASGIFQAMPSTLTRLGWRLGPDAFRQLTAEEQLPFVRAYYLPYKGKLKSVAALYVATFLPALIDHAGHPEYVLVRKGGQLGWAYAPNAGFDADHNLAITVRELEQAVARQCRGPRWEEILFRLVGADAPAEEPQTFDLRTTLGIQESLAALGFLPGPLDGIPGAKTRGAVMEFQRYATLVSDGLVGPLTRAALQARLDEAEPPPAVA